MKYTYIKKNNKENKHNKHNKENKHNEHKSKKKLRTRTKKHTKISIKKNNKSKLLHKTQKKQSQSQRQKQKQIGGSDNKHSNTKEKFEVHSLKNFDYDKYKLSKGANIDWSSIGGPPPEPNCCIC